MTRTDEGRMLLVGLGHRARHGKNFLARLIRQAVLRTTDADCIEMTFGADLKAHCRVAYGMRRKNGKLLQQVGTNVYRDCVDPDIWVDCLEAQVADLEADLGEAGPRCIVLIPDMRFPNEMNFIKRRNGLTVRVTRMTADGTSRYVPADGRDPNHPSETALDNSIFDYAVTANSGELRTLHKAAEIITQDIGKWSRGEAILFGADIYSLNGETVVQH